MTANIVAAVPAVAVELTPGADAAYSPRVPGHLLLSGGYAWTPLSFSGDDLDARVLFAPADYTTGTDQTLASHYNATGGRSWQLRVALTTGAVKTIYTTDGATGITVTGTGGAGVDGEPMWYRLARDKATGTMSLYAADGTIEAPEDTDWFPYGSAVNDPGVAPFPTTVGLMLGGSSQVPPASPAANTLTGKIYAAEYYSNGVLIASPDFRDATAGMTSLTDDQGNVWNLVDAASIVADVPEVNVGEATLLSALLTVQAAPVIPASGGGSGGSSGIGLDWIPVDGLAAFHAALADGNADIVCIGDSITEYAAATTRANAWTSVALAQIRASYQPPGVTGGEGHLQPWMGAAVLAGVDPWTRVGGVNVTTSGFALKGYELNTAGDSMSATLTFDRLDILYRRSLAGGTVNVVIDGGAPTAIDMSGLDSSEVATITVAAGAHTVAITNVSGVNVIEGVFRWNDDTTEGVRLWNVGHGGYSATDWAANTAWTQALARVPAPALVTIMLGINDMNDGTPPAQVVTALSSIVAAIRSTVSASIVVINEWQGNGTPPVGTPPWDDYETAIYDMVVADGGLCFYDARERQGDAVTHPNDVGHSAIGLGLATLVMP